MKTTTLIIGLFFVAVMMMTLTVAAGSETPLTRDELTSKNGPIVIHPSSHASFVIEWNSKTILVDPVGGSDAYAAFGKAQLILLTHAHGDHLNVEILRGVSTAKTVVMAPSTVAAELPEDLKVVTKVLANGDRAEWQEASIEAVPMYNLSEDRQRFHPKGDGNGYVLTLGGTRIYIAGDTEDIPEMRALENIDAAFVCMNLPYTMTPAMVADGARGLGAGILYPYHYGKTDVGELVELLKDSEDIEVRIRKMQ